LLVVFQIAITIYDVFVLIILVDGKSDGNIQ